MAGRRKMKCLIVAAVLAGIVRRPRRRPITAGTLLVLTLRHTN
jgi:hypothetical protein